MTTNGDEGDPNWADRVVAEFGDGLDVEGIALRYGLTVVQVYAVVEREVGSGNQHLAGQPSQGPPPIIYGPPTYQMQPSAPPRYPPPGVPVPVAYPGWGRGLQASPGLPDEDAIVAEYAEGHDVDWIARKHGIKVAQVYEAVRRTVDDDPRSQPRDIPTLYPAYFVDLLSSGRVATSSTNVSRLVERTAFMIGCQGAAYCAQSRDPVAFEVFVRNFAKGGIPDRRLHLVDDMVDWLWAWDPRCHDDLRWRFSGWRDGLLRTESFLIPGQDIAPFNNDKTGGFHCEATWRMVYAENAR